MNDPAPNRKGITNPVTPQAFVDKWRSVTASERAVVQTHYNDLCDLLGVPKPYDLDPTGTVYGFEKTTKKTDGRAGRADVFRKNCFVWEYKGKGEDLEKALAQARGYVTYLDNVPLIVACDIDRYVVVTNWTNTVSERREFRNDDLVSPEIRRFLRLVIEGSDELRPGQTRAALTAKAAGQFALLARELTDAGHDPLRVAHFVNRLVFCLYAQRVGLLENELFTKLLTNYVLRPAKVEGALRGLFEAMHRGGAYGPEEVPWFNGGLFDDGEALPLETKQIRTLLELTELDWSAIDPSIMGTLFERGLNPKKRTQLGAHYTDPVNILRIVDPVVLRPLERDFDETREAILATPDPARRSGLRDGFLSRLRSVTVLDPACGSGNFLYMALRRIKDLEHAALREFAALGLGWEAPRIGPEIVRGIEIDPYAAELARTSVWIGHLQWHREKDFEFSRDPILRSLETIENRDALLNPDGSEAAWPPARFIVGNPPFLGGNQIRKALGQAITDALFATYRDRLPSTADLCAYWFVKSNAAIKDGSSDRAGLLATQSIRGGVNRIALQRIVADGEIFEAWDDFPWILDGAQVHVSTVCFGRKSFEPKFRNGVPVDRIHANLTAAEIDITQREVIAGRDALWCYGSQEKANFSVSEAAALDWLSVPNPHGVPNSDVIRPSVVGKGLVSARGFQWVIDFADKGLEDSARYDAPFTHVEKTIYPDRKNHKEPRQQRKWWLHARPSTLYRQWATADGFQIGTVQTSKHHILAKIPSFMLADHAVILFRGDDYTFGVLHSRIHELWALAQGTQLEDRPRYTPTTCFETFPFPEPTDPQRAEIAAAAAELDRLRENWLNPPEWTQEETLTFPATVGGPWHRHIPKADTLPAGTVAEARYVRRVPKRDMGKLVGARTLTNLYNARPPWLRLAHERLDTAVATAYGWPTDLPEDEVLAKLLALNLERAG